MDVALHDGQHRIWQEVLEAQKKGSRHFVISCPRQWGKTFMFSVLLVYYGTLETKHPYKMMWVSQYLKNTKDIFGEVLQMIEGTDLLKKSNKSEMRIDFRTGSYVKFCGADNPVSIRGSSNRLLFCDEFAHWNNVDDTWDMILSPTTIAFKDAMVFFISTPAGKNKFWDMKVRGEDIADPSYSYFTGKYEENPFCDKDYIEEQRLSLPNEIFQQEYMAEFIDFDTGVFRNVEACSNVNSFSPPEYGAAYFAGIDWGRINDSTVLTIMNSQGEVVFVWENKKGMHWNEILKDVTKHCKRYRIKHGYAEANSAGDVLLDSLRIDLPAMEKWHMTNDRKVDLIEGLQLAFEECTINIPTDKCYPKTRNQLGSFIRKPLPSGKIAYAASGKKHDDHVISLCLAHQSFKKHQMHGSYFLM